MVWNLWFTERFTAYPKLGLGYSMPSWSDDVYGANALQLGVGFTL